MCEKKSKILVNAIFICVSLITITKTSYVRENFTTTISNPSPPVFHDNWTRSEIMDSNGLYILEWWIKSENIHFRVTANTRGFIGLGFSYKSKSMPGSDIVFAWVDDRTKRPNILDCHEKQNGDGTPVQDDTQNYNIIGGTQNMTHTQVEFSRALETCDPHDTTIKVDTIKVQWSFGEKDPIHGELHEHARNRGWKLMNLLEPKFRKKINRNVRQWDVTVDNVPVVENMDTLYWCKIFKAPSLLDKHHIVGYEALLTKESFSEKPLVHHMTLFECSPNGYPGTDPKSWDIWVKSIGAICNSNLLTPRDWDSCITPVAVWTIGSTGQFLPEHVGIPMAGKSGPKYYMLEIHYDNPKEKKIIDHSGFRIHYTPELRKNDAGVMISGVSVSDTQLIPPGQKLYRNVGICGPSCTSSIFPEDGIKIVSATLHSHVAGRKMKLRHVRDGQELDRIVEDENYNHNYQQVRQLTNERVVLPGDFVITDCAYETTGRKRPTFGGYSTKHEICLSFVTYYPRTDLAGCYSMTPVREFFETFGVYQFYNFNMTQVENLFLYNGNILDLMPSTGTTNSLSRGLSNNGNPEDKIKETEEDIVNNESLLNQLIISDPVEFHDRTFLAHLNQLPWSEPLFTRRVEQGMLTGKHMTFCRVTNTSITIPSEIIRYPNFTTLIKDPSPCPFQLFIEETASSLATRRRFGLEIKFLIIALCVIS